MTNQGKPALTARQQAIYDFIVDFRRRQGCSPSIPELQKAFSIRSPNGVAGHLLALEAKGMIRRSKRGSRQIDVVEEARSQLARNSIFSLPVFGQIPAGPPESIPAAGSEGCIALDTSALGFEPPRGSFALKVRGDSMKDAGILEGDIVVVQPNPSPRAGQIVVALIDGESTLKRLVRVNNRWFLKAENPAYDKLVPRSELVIQGVVRAVLRNLD